MGLNFEPNIAGPDGFYDALNARLILVRVSHIGDRAVVTAALKAA